MDVVGEVIIGNKIYSARYGEPPRELQVADDASQTPPADPRRPLNDSARVPAPNAGACVTDLDEWPQRAAEPDYINLRGNGAQRSRGKVFTNAYGHEENIYEEINELHKHMRRHVPRGPADVIDEVARVQIGHNSVLRQLNLDLEDFLEPEPSEVSPSEPEPQDKQPDPPANVTPEPQPRPKSLKMIAGRSKSTVSFTMPQSTAERSITRSGSMDLTGALPRRLHRQASSASGSSHRRLNSLSSWTEKCSHLLGKRGKKFIKRGNHSNSVV